MRHKCTYCRLSFAKESTLIAHVCERKRRFQQQHEIGVQWGFQSYLLFDSTLKKAKTKTYEDFVNSNYYTAFVRFGRHCHSVYCINLASYTRWLLKNNIKLDNWCTDTNYNKWLLDYLSKESVHDALERSIETMNSYMLEHPEYRNGYRDYFRLVNENRICYHITTGRLSVWAVYHCSSGQDFLARLNPDQVAMVIDYIDPDRWQSRFRDSSEDVAFSKQVLEAAGL